jgi:hypothetical protein
MFVAIPWALGGGEMAVTALVKVLWYPELRFVEAAISLFSWDGLHGYTFG